MLALLAKELVLLVETLINLNQQLLVVILLATTRARNIGKKTGETETAGPSTRANTTGGNETGAATERKKAVSDKAARKRHVVL